MANAFVALGAVTLTSSDSSVTFHNIPSIYEDLYLSIVGTLTGSATMYVRLNNDVGPNYRYVSAAGDNANGLYQESSTQTYIPNAPAFATSTAFQADYEIIGAGSARYKNALVHYAMNGQSLNIVSSTWRNTGVVQTVEALLSANSYAAGTTLRLFGVIA